MHYKIKDLSIDERPYEKFIKYGPKVLSDSELLAVIIKNGTRSKSSIEIAREVLKMPDGNLSLTSIFKKDYLELNKIEGIGNVKAITIKCIAELTERIYSYKNPRAQKYDKPEIIARIYMERLRHLNKEEIIAVYLNSSNLFISDEIISLGTINTSIFSSRDIFIKALKCEAVNIILLHNHPSGNPIPSYADIESTQNLIKAGRLLNINITDHIIIGDLNYISFRQTGIMDDNGDINMDIYKKLTNEIIK